LQVEAAAEYDAHHLASLDGTEDVGQILIARPEVDEELAGRVVGRAALTKHSGIGAFDEGDRAAEVCRADGDVGPAEDADKLLAGPHKLSADFDGVFDVGAGACMTLGPCFS
jgi:hypothetical protein